MKPRLHLGRFAVVLSIVCALVFGLWWLKSYGIAAMPIPCFFHQLTGLHCPGCGMTRATAALVNGDLLSAFRFNPLGVLLLPLALLGLVLESIGWVRNTSPPWRIPLGKHGAKIIAIAVILFMVLRNLPWFPFSLLAPHG